MRERRNVRKSLLTMPSRDGILPRTKTNVVLIAC